MGNHYQAIRTASKTLVRKLNVNMFANSMLDKIQDMGLQENEEEEERTYVRPIMSYAIERRTETTITERQQKRGP